MKITILGTGAPEAMPYLLASTEITNVERLRPSVLIESQNTTILLDISPDIRIQLLRSKITKLDSVFVTHPHFDHIWGIGDLDQLHWKNLDTFSVYLHPKNIEYLATYIPWLSLKCEPLLEEKKIGDISITPFLIEHTDLFPTYGFLIMADNKKVVYVPDIKKINSFELFKDIDVLIGDGQYILGKYIEDDDHLGGEELIDELQKFNAKSVYLIGYSEFWYKKSAKEALKELPQNFIIPNDMDVMELK